MSVYPENLEEALGRPLKFPVEALYGVRAFASSKPWQGTFADCQAKFRQLHADLCRIYGVNPTLAIEGDGTGDSGGSSFQPRANVITLRGQLSVITFLHEWGHVLRGGSEYEACRWSLRLFRKCFPASWARLTWEGMWGERANAVRPTNGQVDLRANTKASQVAAILRRRALFSQSSRPHTRS